MKKRFFAIFLAVCLVATLLPAGVLAADGTQTIHVGGEELASTDGGTVYARRTVKAKSLSAAAKTAITSNGTARR